MMIASMRRPKREFGKQLTQVGLAVDGPAIQACASGYEMGVTQMDNEVVGPWIFWAV
jgi:hypothetical protein